LHAMSPNLVGEGKSARDELQISWPIISDLLSSSLYVALEFKAERPSEIRREIFAVLGSAELWHVTGHDLPELHGFAGTSVVQRERPLVTSNATRSAVCRVSLDIGIAAPRRGFVIGCLPGAERFRIETSEFRHLIASFVNLFLNGFVGG